MNTLKGFSPHAELAVNTPGVVNEIGEISTISMTYTREPGLYVSQDASGIALISFLSKNDAGQTIEVDYALKEHVLRICNHVYQKTLTQPNVQVDALQLINELVATFGTEAEEFRSGAIATDNTYFVPQWLSWKSKTNPTQIKIWFADDSFQRQYDEYEIVVAPPIIPLDDFFKMGSVVEELLKAKDMTIVAEELQTAKDGHPETVVRVDMFKYYDPNDASRIVPSYWGILIYGLAGNNPDAIKEKLREYILSHSAHTRDEWAEILPDIFKSTEFLFVPMWDRFAIPTSQLRTGIYNANTPIGVALDKVTQVAVNSTQAHINAYMSLFTHHYKCVSVACLSGLENRDSMFDLNDAYEDFLPIASTSIDFNRMRLATQNFAEWLAKMIIAAESFTEFGDIPEGMMKIVRDGRVYLSRSINNVTYLVLTKASI